MTAILEHAAGLTATAPAARLADVTKTFGRGTDAVTVLTDVDTAAKHCPSLQTKTVTPHVLWHSAAMALLHAGVDITVIALWLGHESPTSTRVYLHADMALKERALARTTPPDTSPGRYHAPDTLLAFLNGL